MAILSYKEIEKRIDMLVSRGNIRDDMVLQYILSPYVQSLGYNIFNLEEVEKLNDGTYKVKVFEDEEDGLENIYFIFSTGDRKSLYLGDNGVRSYLHLNMKDEKMLLSHKVFGKWVGVYDAKFNVKDTDHEDVREEEDSFISINKLMNKDEFNKKYIDIGERFFSGTVVDSYLVNKDYVNDFIEDCLIEELLHPSDEFKNVLALSLKRYSLHNTDWVVDSIDELTGEDLLNNISNALERGTIHLSRKRKQDTNKDIYEEIEIKRDKENPIDIKEKGVKIEEDKKDIDEVKENTRLDKEEDKDIQKEINLDDEENPFELLEGAGFDVGEDLTKGNVERKRVDDRHEGVTGMVDIMSSLD